MYLYNLIHFSKLLIMHGMNKSSTFEKNNNNKKKQTNKQKQQQQKKNTHTQTGISNF